MKALLSALFFLFMSTSFAEDLRYYDVEIVVIENQSEDAKKSEHWPLEVTIKKPVNSVTLGEPPLVEWLPLDVDLAESFKILTPEDYQLTAEVDKISASRSQRVIFHTAWRQPGLDKKIAMPVYFKYEVTDTPLIPKIADMPLIHTEITDAYKPDDMPVPAVLEGIFRVTLSRYLHLESELSYRIPPIVITETETEFTDEIMPDEAEKQGVIYLKQKRNRIRSNELHYIDHPVISLLVKMTPYIKPEVPKETRLEIQTESSLHKTN